MFDSIVYVTSITLKCVACVCASMCVFGWRQPWVLCKFYVISFNFVLRSKQSSNVHQSDKKNCALMLLCEVHVERNCDKIMDTINHGLHLKFRKNRFFSLFWFHHILFTFLTFFSYFCFNFQLWLFTNLLSNLRCYFEASEQFFFLRKNKENKITRPIRKRLFSNLAACFGVHQRKRNWNSIKIQMAK